MQKQLTMIKKFKKSKDNLKLVNQKVKDLVPDTVVEKAASINLKNPLATSPNDPPMKLEDVPEITSETIAEHREEVLSGARRYIYPLQHSKHRIVVVTLTIMVSAIVASLVYCTAALYRYYQYNTFLYRVTQVVPFPIAKADGRYVSYENYLFNLRRYVHYYQTQQQSNLSAPSQKAQLLQYRKQALANVIDDAYIKNLAAQHKITVSDSEVSDRIAEVRQQNKLGSDDKVFANVLSNYWGWSVNDFKRALKTQILDEKVAAVLDVPATQKAQSVIAQIKQGADFAALARGNSEDTATAANGGDYGFAITRTNPNVPPQVIDELFKLKAGQTSGIINAGTSLEIVKANQVSSDSVTAQHITIKLNDISVYLKPLEAKNPPHDYVKF